MSENGSVRLATKRKTSKTADATTEAAPKSLPADGHGALPAPLAADLAAQPAPSPREEVAEPTKSAASASFIDRVSEVPGLAASAKLINIPEGLFALTVAASDVDRDIEAISTPATHIAAFSEGTTKGVRVLDTRASPSGWMGPAGGTVILEAPALGGRVMVTTYRPASKPAAPVSLQLSRLDRPAAPPSAASTPAEHSVRLEIKLHFEKQQPWLGKDGEWCGAPGQKRRVEAFELRPQGELQSSDIEYRAFAPNGRQTDWKTGGQICGAVGRGMPLVGFAIRLAPQAQARYSARYRGSFFEGGEARGADGSACLSLRQGDNLEALEIQIVRRA